MPDENKIDTAVAPFLGRSGCRVRPPCLTDLSAVALEQVDHYSPYGGVGRSCGVGRGLGVTLGVALGVGVAVGLRVELGVGDTVGLGVGVGAGPIRFRCTYR